MIDVLQIFWIVSKLTTTFYFFSQSYRFADMDRITHLWPDITSMAYWHTSWCTACDHVCLSSLSQSKVHKFGDNLATFRFNEFCQDTHLSVIGTLSYAANKGNIDMFRFYATLHSSVAYKERMSLFTTAVGNDHLAVCQFLVSDVGLTLDELRQSSALQDAAKMGRLSMCQFLKDQGFTLDDVRARNNSALRSASAYGHLPVIQFFKDWGLTIQDVLDGPRKFDTSFLLAAESGHAHVLQYFKEWRDPSGSQLTLQDVRARNNLAFSLAASYGHVQVLQFFKEWRDPDGSRLTIQDVRDDSNNALLMAARNGHLNVCQFLKNWGTDPTDGSGLTLDDLSTFHNYALRKARNYGHTKVVKFLICWRNELKHGSLCAKKK